MQEIVQKQNKHKLESYKSYYFFFRFNYRVYIFILKILVLNYKLKYSNKTKRFGSSTGCHHQRYKKNPARRVFTYRLSLIHI